MKHKLSLLLVVVFCALIVPSKSLATNWAYSFVVWMVTFIS
jgi:nitrate reductase NapE component